MEVANHRLERAIEGQKLHLSISHKIFPLPVIEKTLFLLRDLITNFEVTETASDNIRVCIAVVSTDASDDIEDLFYSRLISTAVSLMHEENSRDIKQYFIQTAIAAMMEPQQALKRHLVAQTRAASQSQTNPVAYWEQYKGYRVELGNGFDIFVEEDANTFHLDLDHKIYSLAHVQLVIDKVAAHNFECTISMKRLRVIVTITFQKETTQRVMLKTLIDLQKSLRILEQ